MRTIKLTSTISTNARTKTCHIAARMLLITLLAILIVCGSGCGSRTIKHKIESEIAKSVQKTLGQTKSCRVELTGSVLSIARGNIKEMKIYAEDLHLKNGITLAQLEVSLKDLQVDTNSHIMKRCAEARYKACVTSKEVQNYLLKRYPNIPGLAIEPLEGKLYIKVTPSVAGISIPIEAIALPKARHGTEVAVDFQKIDVAWVPTPGFAREYLEKRLNPILKATDLGFDAQIEQVFIDGEVLVLTGIFDPSQVLDRSTYSTREKKNRGRT
ncbi:MAG: LmeA family phospholipid-binding protein [Armatimonadota bacterium]